MPPTAGGATSESGRTRMATASRRQARYRAWMRSASLRSALIPRDPRRRLPMARQSAAWRTLSGTMVRRVRPQMCRLLIGLAPARHRQMSQRYISRRRSPMIGIRLPLSRCQAYWLSQSWSICSPAPRVIIGISLELTPDVRKRPWGAGAFRSRLGVGVVYISTWRLWGAGKEPREFLKLMSPLANE